MNTEPTYLPIEEPEVRAINTLCVTVNDWAQKKGWNDKVGDRNITLQLARYMNVFKLMCQNVEAIRKGEDVPDYDMDVYVQEVCDEMFVDGIGVDEEQLIASSQLCLFVTEIAEAQDALETNKLFDDHVPTLPAIPAELADLLIRVFHFCGKNKIDLGSALQVKHNYNITRPYKHGKKI